MIIIRQKEFSYLPVKFLQQPYFGDNTNFMEILELKPLEKAWIKLVVLYQECFCPPDKICLSLERLTLGERGQCQWYLQVEVKDALNM